MMTREKAIEAARSSGWLSEQPAEFQEELLARCRLRSYREKEALYQVGDPCIGVFALVSGVVRIEFATGGGDYRIAAVKQPICWLGNAASLRRSGYYVTATASTPVTALHLPHNEFERLIENPAYCRSFAVLTVDQFSEAVQVIGQLLVGDVESRVAARLALLAEHSVDKRPVVVPVTQSDLAEMCGLSRPTVQQVLSTLEKRGLIRPGYRRIEVLEPEELVRHCGRHAASAVSTPALQD